MGFINALFSDINANYYQDLNYERVDRLMLKILWWQFVIITLGTLAIYFFRPSDFYPSAFSWRDLALPEVVGSIALGFLASFIPTLLRGKLANHYHYRLLVMAAYMMYSFILILVSGGSIEMHFYLFGIWSLLILYYDSRLIWVGFAIMLLHRIILNYVHPIWLYHYGRNDVAFFAHLIFAFLAAFFIAHIAMNGRRSMISVSEANKLLKSRVAGTAQATNTTSV